MSSIYGYARVSTAQQSESGLSIDAQRERIAAERKTLVKRLKLSAGKTYVDRGVSATRYGMVARPAGGQLDRVLQRGDHVIIAKLDRGFRSTRDCVVTLERWTERGVITHLLDLGVATDTPLGRMLIGILATIAQWEASRIGERNRDKAAAMKARGLAANGHRRLGYRLVAGGRLVPNPAERKIGGKITRWRDRDKLEWRDICDRLRRERVRRPNGQRWTHQACRRLYEAQRLRWP
jgi:DNA invertase Pin-like site-specific DNA recombinase